MNKVCIYCGQQTAIFNGNNYYCMNCDKEWSDQVLLTSEPEDSPPRKLEDLQIDELDEDEMYSPI